MHQHVKMWSVKYKNLKIFFSRSNCGPVCFLWYWHNDPVYRETSLRGGPRFKFALCSSFLKRTMNPKQLWLYLCNVSDTDLLKKGFFCFYLSISFSGLVILNVFGAQRYRDRSWRWMLYLSCWHFSLTAPSDSNISYEEYLKKCKHYLFLVGERSVCVCFMKGLTRECRGIKTCKEEETLSLNAEKGETQLKQMNSKHLLNLDRL